MPVVGPFVTSRQEIAGVRVAELARRFGTPTYVYDAAKIVERINDLKQFDVIRYAQKACSNIAILSLARRNGVVVDAVHPLTVPGLDAERHLIVLKAAP